MGIGVVLVILALFYFLSHGNVVAAIFCLLLLMFVKDEGANSGGRHGVAFRRK